MKATIELECPGCGELLELDAGFAGGVCRCYSCGTLMTVPSDSSKGQAERVARPDRPDAPGRSTTAPPVPSPRIAPSPGAAVPSTPVSPAASVPSPSVTSPTKPLRGPAPATPAGPVPATEPETFVTASGRVIRLHGTSDVPIAQRKKKVRFATTTIFFMALGGLLLLGIIIATMIMRQQGNSNVSARLGYDPEVNYLLATQPGFLGRTWAKSNVITVDLVGTSKAWWSILRRNLPGTMQRAADGTTFQLIVATDAGPKFFPNQPTPFKMESLPQLTSFMESVASPGLPDLSKAVAAALRAAPERITLISSRTMDGQLVEALTQLFEAHPQIKLDVILIDREASELQVLAHKHQGRYLSLPLTQLVLWNAGVVD